MCEVILEFQCRHSNVFCDIRMCMCFGPYLDGIGSIQMSYRFLIRMESSVAFEWHDFECFIRMTSYSIRMTHVPENHFHLTTQF